VARLISSAAAICAQVHRCWRVLRCPRCAGRMQLIATIEDPAAIQPILAHLGLPGTREGAPPAC